jgi:hypothetical protein
MTDTETRYVELEGCPGYRVGDDGSVQSRHRRGRGANLRDEWRDLLPDSRHGRVRLRDEAGKYHDFTAVRLVLEAFVGPPPDEFAVCRFKDGDPTNRRADNLEWGRFKGFARKRATIEASTS